MDGELVFNKMELKLQESEDCSFTEDQVLKQSACVFLLLKDLIGREKCHCSRKYCIF